MQLSLLAGSRFETVREVPTMLSYPRFHAAEVIPAAFGAVPAGLATVAALRNCDTTGMTSIDMTKFFGQARPPRKIPL